MKTLKYELLDARAEVKKWEDSHRLEVGDLMTGMLFKPGDFTKAPYPKLKAVLDRCVEIDEKEKLLVLHFNYPYHIELSRINTPKKLLGWILHLNRKNWMEKDAMNAIIKKLASYYGWDLKLNG